MFSLAFLNIAGPSSKLFRLFAVLALLVLSGGAVVASGGAGTPVGRSAVSPSGIDDSGAPSWSDSDAYQSQLCQGAFVSSDRGSDTGETVKELEFGEERAFLPSGLDSAALESQGFDLSWRGDGEATTSGFRSRAVLVRLLVLRPGARAPPRV